MTEIIVYAMTERTFVNIRHRAKIMFVSCFMQTKKGRCCRLIIQFYLFFAFLQEYPYEII